MTETPVEPSVLLCNVDETLVIEAPSLAFNMTISNGTFTPVSAKMELILSLMMSSSISFTPAVLPVLSTINTILLKLL